MPANSLYIKKGKLGIKGLLIIIYNEIKALNSNRHLIYGNLFSPVLYFLFFSFGIQSTFGNLMFNGEYVSFISYSLVGIFAMSIFREMYQCVFRMVTDKRWGLLSAKLLNGVAPPLYLLGISTFPIIGVLVQVSILYTLSVAMRTTFPFVNLLLIMPFLICCILFWSSILLCIAMLVKNYKQRDFVMNTMMLPVMFSAPLFFSLENAPLFLRIVSNVNPLTHQVQAMRLIAFGMPANNQIWLVFALAVVAFCFATFLLSRIDFRSAEH